MSAAQRLFHHLHLCVIPHPANDHRPLALRHGPLSAFSALLISAKILALLIISLTPATAELSTITAARIVQLTNAEREKAGLKALTVNASLNNAAAQKAKDMLSQQYFAHISPTGVTPWFWMKKVGYSYQVAGENLAIDFTDAEDVVSAWLASPTHRENMLLPDYTETGVAVITGEFQGGTSTIVVHMFGLPLNKTPQVNKTILVPASTPKPTLKPSPEPSKKPTDTPVPTVSPTPSPTPVPITTPDPTPPLSLDRGQISFWLTPQTDAPKVLTYITPTSQNLNFLQLHQGYVQNITPNNAIAVVSLDQQPIILSVKDKQGDQSPPQSFNLTPEFKTPVESIAASWPSLQVSNLTRNIAAALFITMVVLLSLAILIRIRIQHPTLIAHASFVILIAAVLFLF